MSCYEEYEESPVEKNIRLKSELQSLKEIKSQKSLDKENLRLTAEVKKLRIELGLERQDDDYQY